MPVIDGYEATRRLRALGNNTPIIGLTAVLSPEARAKGLAASMNEFFEKPLEPATLKDLIDRYPAR